MSQWKLFIVARPQEIMEYVNKRPRNQIRDLHAGSMDELYRYLLCHRPPFYEEQITDLAMYTMQGDGKRNAGLRLPSRISLRCLTE